MTTFIDVGGHIGKSTDTVLRKHPKWKVIIFECNPILANRLKEKYAGVERVRVMDVALWNKNSTETFYISAEDDGSSLHGEKNNLVLPETVEVKCLRASDFINTIDDKIVLYLNCEGAEFEIIEDLLGSGIYKKIRGWFVAFHHQKANLNCQERYNQLTEKAEKCGIVFGSHYDFLRR